MVTCALWQCGYTRAETTVHKNSAYTEKPTPPLVEEETPILKHMHV
jgi:hypothetical protein